MKVDEISKALKSYTDEQLKHELEIRRKKRRGKLLGYRVIAYGDEYDYGCYSDIIIGECYWRSDMKPIDKKIAKIMAEEELNKSKNGGSIQEIYKDTPKPDRIY